MGLKLQAKKKQVFPLSWGEGGLDQTDTTIENPSRKPLTKFKSAKSKTRGVGKNFDIFLKEKKTFQKSILGGSKWILVNFFFSSKFALFLLVDQNQ